VADCLHVNVVQSGGSKIQSLAASDPVQQIVRRSFDSQQATMLPRDVRDKWTFDGEMLADIPALHASVLPALPYLTLVHQVQLNEFEVKSHWRETAKQ